MKIAVIDSGIDLEHRLLIDKIDFKNSKSYDQSNSVLDDTGHGTGVAGLIAQIAPKSKITIYKAMAEGQGKTSWIIQAIIDAVNDGNHIINLSVGTYSNINTDGGKMTIEAFRRALEYAKLNNVTVFAASGNDSLDLDKWKEKGYYSIPGGSLAECYTVSSINKNNTKTTFSNYGSEVDFVAPGGDYLNIHGGYDLSQQVLIAYPMYFESEYERLNLPKGYTLESGTSLATPMVSGIFALYIEREMVKNRKKEFNIDKVMKELKKDIVDLGPKGIDNDFGEGKVIKPKN